MFKRLLFLSIFLLLVSSVFAVRLIDPIYTDLKGNDFVGSIIPGSTLELTFSKEFDKYESLSLISNLPSGFNAKVVNETDFSKVFIYSPTNAVVGEYPLTFEIVGEKQSVVFNIYFLIQNDLLNVSSDNYFSNALVSEPSIFNFTFINDSYADVNFIVKPQLPWFWLSDNFVEKEPLIVTVPLRSSKQEKLVVYPRKQGEIIFDTTVFFDNSKLTKTFSQRITASPSIGGKFESIFFGLPFYSFSLMPNYLINGFLSLYFN